MPKTAVQLSEDRALNTRPIGPRILLVDHEESIQETLNSALPSAGYALYQVRNGKEAAQKVQSVRPDLILLHLASPEKNGGEVIGHLRASAIAPIIVISVHREESEKISSLDSGAHDYLTMPFSVPELLARMRAALRSVSAAPHDVFTVGDLRVDLGRRQVFVGEAAARLTATEYDLLKVLVRHAGSVRAHHQLIHDLWGGTHYQDSVHLLRVTLSHLRRKLQPEPTSPRYIMTEPGVGYRLRTESSARLEIARQHA